MGLFSGIKLYKYPERLRVNDSVRTVYVDGFARNGPKENIRTITEMLPDSYGECGSGILVRLSRPHDDRECPHCGRLEPVTGWIDASWAIPIGAPDSDIRENK